MTRRGTHQREACRVLLSLLYAVVEKNTTEFPKKIKFAFKYTYATQLAESIFECRELPLLPNTHF